MDRIKKILIVLIIIVLLEGIAIITLHQRRWVNTDLITNLANRDVITNKLIYNLQKDLSEIKLNSKF